MAAARRAAGGLASRDAFAVDPHRFGVIGRCAGCQRHEAGQLLACLSARVIGAGCG